MTVLDDECSPATHSPVTAFTTLGLTRGARTTAWREFARTRLLDTGCTVYSRDGAVVSLRHLSLDGIAVSEGTHNHLMMERTPEAIARRRSDTVMMLVLLEGSAFHYHRRGSIVLSPGDALLCDSDVPGAQGYSEGSRVLALRIERSLFFEQTGDSRIAVALATRELTRSGDGTAEENLLRRVRAGLRGHGTSKTIEQDVLSLLGSAVDRLNEGRSHYVLSARQHIRAHLADPALSVSDIARALAISERQLSRTFAASGTTVVATITELRLQRARRLLVQEDPAGMPIGRLAHTVGFRSPSSFSHVYRRRFGRSPSEERASARQAGQPRDAN